jgi:hypothetical protein
VPEIKAFRVINSRLVESLARELDLPLGDVMQSENEISAGKLLGLRRKASRTRQAMSARDPRLVGPIVEALRESGQLRIYRPETSGDFWNSDHRGWYIQEDMVATPVLIPLSGQMPANVPAPDALNVWIADPTPLHQPKVHDWEIVGSNVFLVEELGDFSWRSSGFVSGVTALKIISHLARFPRLLDEDTAWEGMRSRTLGDFGDWVEVAPSELLREIGGMPGVPRRIETVYKIAYMSNESFHVTDGSATRVNDILAYPLYIADI